MTKKKRTWIFTLLALLIAALHISPFYIMINMSLKTLSDRSSRWMPALHPHFENYVTAMEHGNLMSAMWNTFQITALSVIIIVVAGAMAAYPLARKASRKNQIILTFIVGVMMVPQAYSILVPLYKEMVTLERNQQAVGYRDRIRNLPSANGDLYVQQLHPQHSEGTG